VWKLVGVFLFGDVLVLFVVLDVDEVGVVWVEDVDVGWVLCLLSGQFDYDVV